MHLSEGKLFRGRAALLKWPPAGRIIVVADDDAALDRVWATLTRGEPRSVLKHEKNKTAIVVAENVFGEQPAPAAEGGQ